MKFLKTKIAGVYIITPELKKDARGYFGRIFCLEEMRQIDPKFRIVQSNISSTLKKGTVRGMHFQKHPRSEGKIVQCLQGSVYDVVVDLRKNSPTYGKWVGQELSEKNRKMFFIPKGLAHGFQCLSAKCEMLYFMSEFYSPEHASGVRWNDPMFKIKWPVPVSNISDKDKNWTLFSPDQI